MKYNKKGFSLLELTLAIGIGSVLAFIKFQDMVHEQENLHASVVGQQIKQIGEAVNGYINIRYDKLSTLSSSSSQSTDPGPRSCNSNSCEITISTLINEGLLPSNYQYTNPYGSSYKLVLKRSGTSPNYIINGLITTTSAWSEGGHIRYDLLGKAMQVAGIDSGMSKSTTTMSGHSGIWSETSSNYSNIDRAGILGYRVGYDSAMYSVYLRRDGTLPMTGNLNMGGNDINNAKNITASENANIGGDGVFGGNVSAQKGSFKGNVGVRGMSADNQPDGFLGGIVSPDVYAQAGIYIAKNGANIKDKNWAFQANRDGYLAATGNANIGGSLTTGGNIYSGHEVRARNGSGDSIWFGGADGNGDYEIRLDSPIPLTLWQTNQIKRSDTILSIWGSTNIGGNLNVTNAGDANGDINASGNIKGNTITSNNRLTTNEYLQVNGQATVGNGCSPNGLVGRESSGTLLYCKDGSWRSSGGTARQCNTNGCYMTLFDGTVLQWGRTQNNQGGNSPIYFPTTFPNACLNVSLTATSNSLSGNAKNVPYVDLNTITSSGVWVSNGQRDASGIMWYAIGY